MIFPSNHNEKHLNKNSSYLSTKEGLNKNILSLTKKVTVYLLTLEATDLKFQLEEYIDVYIYIRIIQGYTSRMYVWVNLLLLINQGVFLASADVNLIDHEESSYRITQDFVFQSTPKHHLLYNPEVMHIVKKIDLTPMSKIAEILLELLSRYRSVCDQLDKFNQNLTQSPTSVKVPSPGTTVIKGVDTCKRMGMKLVELRTHWDVSRFISEVQPGVTSTPAAIFYDKRIQSFDHLRDGIVITHILENMS